MNLFKLLVKVFVGNQFGNQIDDILYHESGHVVVSSLFDDVFDIEFVTVDSVFSQSHDARTLGGVKGRTRKSRSVMNVIEIDALILMHLAGLCADDINNTKGKIPEDYYSIPVWAAKFNRAKYSGDIEVAGQCFEQIKGRVNVTWQEYVMNSMKLLHSMFSNLLLWEAVNFLKNDLKKFKTLDANQIKECLSKSEFYDYRTDNIAKIKEQRIKFLGI